MKNYLTKSIFTLAAAACMCSCVNEEYDITKVKFDEIHILDNASAPFGATKKFMLNELFADFETYEFLKTDNDGNYYIEYAGERISTEIEIPDFIFNGYSDENPHETTVNEQIYFPQIVPGIVISPAITTKPVAFDKLTFHVELNQTDIPTEIIGVKYADVESNLIISLGYDPSSLPFSKIWISKGATLRFPEWIVLGKAPDGFEKPDSQTLTLSDDLSVSSSGTQIRVLLDAIDFTKMPEGQGLVEPGALRLDAEVTVEGSVYLSSDDYQNSGNGPFSPTIISHLNMEPMAIQSVSAALDLKAIGYTEFEATFDDLSEGLGDLDATIDLTGLRLNFGVSSTIPSSVDISAILETSANRYDLGLIKLPAGSEGAPGMAYYSISENGTGAPENYTNIAVQNFNTLLSPIPESVKFSLSPSFSDNSYLTIIPGSAYELNIDYSFSSNAFGPSFRIGSSMTFDGLGVNFDTAEIPSAQITLNAVNTLPINFSIAAQTVDSEGNITDSISADVSSDIKGGTLENPAVTPITLSLRSNGPLMFDGLILTFSAASASDCAVLNKAQYLQFTDMALSLPDGATIKFDNNEE